MKLEETETKFGFIVSGNVVPTFDFSNERDPKAEFIKHFGHLIERVKIKENQRTLTFKGFINSLRKL